jgi:hypothetical protein
LGARGADRDVVEHAVSLPARPTGVVSGGAGQCIGAPDNAGHDGIYCPGDDTGRQFCDLVAVGAYGRVGAN